MEFKYVSPSRVLSGLQGTKGVVDIFDLKRVVGHIGYIKANHYSAELGLKTSGSRTQTYDLQVMSPTIHQKTSAAAKF